MNSFGSSLTATQLHVRSVTPEFDVRPVAMDDHLLRRPVDLFRLRVKNAMVAVEVDEFRRDQRVLRGAQIAADLIEFPLGDELVAVEMDAPVPGALATRRVLEPDAPRQVLGCFPLRPENLDLGIDVPDALERRVARESFVDDD